MDVEDGVEYRLYPGKERCSARRHGISPEDSEAVSLFITVGTTTETLAWAAKNSTVNEDERGADPKAKASSESTPDSRRAFPIRKER